MDQLYENWDYPLGPEDIFVAMITLNIRARIMILQEETVLMNNLYRNEFIRDC